LTHGEQKTKLVLLPGKPMKKRVRFDEIGYWSEVKLEILKKYASAYSTILDTRAKPPLYHIYIDAFAGAGVHISKTTQEYVLGSPLNALAVRPPFREYHLIDLDSNKADALKRFVGSRPDVHIYTGDCNQILLKTVFPQVLFQNYRRALCILDPYGLHVDFSVLRRAGEMKSIEVFLNFPVADMNRNVLWHDPEGVAEADLGRMDRFWGDDSWRAAAYRSDTTLFGYPEKESNEAVAEAFRKRLKDIAGFKRVPPPLPMRNSKGAIVYYLLFASQQDTAENIILEIFEKYRS